MANFSLQLLYRSNWYHTQPHCQEKQPTVVKGPQVNKDTLIRQDIPGLTGYLPGAGQGQPLGSFGYNWAIFTQNTSDIQSVRFFSSHQLILQLSRHQLGVLEFISILTLTTQVSIRLPQALRLSLTRQPSPQMPVPSIGSPGYPFFCSAWLQGHRGAHKLHPHSGALNY